MSEPQETQQTPAAPQGADYFAVFGLPRRLAIDGAALTRTFHARSRELHPDRFARAGAEKQQWSLEQTSLLNDAYRALKDPIARTEYLLRLEGVVEPEAAKGRDVKAQAPPELLAEVFELNMQLEEMRMTVAAGEDDAALRAELATAGGGFEAQLASLGEQIQVAGRAWDVALDNEDAAAKQAALKNLAALLDRRRYVRNLVRDVHEALAGPAAAGR